MTTGFRHHLNYLIRFTPLLFKTFFIGVINDLSDPSFIGAVSLHEDTFEAELVHETAQVFGLCRKPWRSRSEWMRRATSSLVFVEEGMDGCLHFRILVFARQARPPIVIDASSHTEHTEESRNGID